MKEKTLRELEREAKARIIAALPRLWDHNFRPISRAEAKGLARDLALVRRAELIDDDEIRMRVRGGVWT